MKKITLLLCITIFYFQSDAQIGIRKVENKSKLGKNILTFSPMNIILTDLEDDQPDLAVGFSYERIFNNDLISFRLPISLSIREKYTYLMPTIKLYPTRQGQVRYSVGPQFLIGFGKSTSSNYVYYQGQYIYRTETIDRKQLGFLINNGLNFTLGKNVYTGLDAGIGIKYYDSNPNYYTSSLTPFGGNSSILFQLNFNMGIRF